MTLSDKLEPQSAAHQQTNRRRFARFKTRFNALVHCHGRFRTVSVEDVSQGGLGLSRTFGLMPDDRVVIELVTGHRLAGTVVWSLGCEAGVALDQPLAADDPLMLRATRSASKR